MRGFFYDLPLVLGIAFFERVSICSRVGQNPLDLHPFIKLLKYMWASSCMTGVVIGVNVSSLPGQWKTVLLEQVAPALLDGVSCYHTAKSVINYDK